MAGAEVELQYGEFLLCFIYIQFLLYVHVYVNFRVNAMYMYVLIIQQYYLYSLLCVI